MKFKKLQSNQVVVTPMIKYDNEVVVTLIIKHDNDSVIVVVWCDGVVGNGVIVIAVRDSDSGAW